MQPTAAAARTICPEHNHMNYAPHAIKPVLAAAVVLAAGGLSACDRSEQGAAAVTQADIKLQAMAPTPQNSSFADKDQYAAEMEGRFDTSNAYAQAVFTDVAALLTPFTDLDNGTGEAAAILVGQAMLGQASEASLITAGAHAQAVRQTRVVRGYLSEWIGLTTLAETSAAYDPTDEIAQIDADVANRITDADAARVQAAEVQARLAELISQIEALSARSKAQRNIAGENSLMLTKVTATEGVELAELIRAATLRADHLSVEVERLQTQHDQILPEATEANLLVKRLVRQRELLDTARAEALERDAAGERDAVSARAGAALAQTEIRTRAASLEQFHTDDLTAAVDATVSKLRQAISSVASARDTAADSAALTKGSANQALGEIFRRQAYAAAIAAQLYEAIDEVGVPGSDYAALATAARARESQALENAAGAYDAAVSAYRSVRVRGEIGDRLDQIADRLAQLGTEPPALVEEDFSDDEQYDDDSFDDDNFDDDQDLDDEI